MNEILTIIGGSRNSTSVAWDDANSAFGARDEVMEPEGTKGF